ncbi:3-phosphoshikimate 1-carboxyvinyltransferase [Haliangium sp.]|uniref:3-phosphoshikimate 1-carboxyvinyltransferase n=1 Tax=Haliangium sp. TaxID=2663208 RepID=UPI003D1455BF
MTAFVVEPSATPLRGVASVPGDKSISHRALLLSALCDGVVRIRGLGSGADNRGTARALRAMGVGIDSAGPAADGDKAAELTVRGVGLRGLRAPAAVIDCGNSGTTMRLLCGLLAAQPFAATLAGDASLTGRPMRRVIDPLSEMGATITGGGGRDPDEVYPPLTVGAPPAPLRAIEYRLPMASAQVKSAVLLAGLYADGVTRVIEPGSTRDHTERMLQHMGAPVAVRGGGVVELDRGGWDERLHAELIEVPADPSQAAFLLAAAVLAGVERVTVPGVCINPTRTGFLDALAEMNVLVEREAMRTGGAEPVADLAISRGAGDDMRATEIGGDLTVRAIDELPILAVVAARAQGTTDFRDAAELRVKESDRIATTCAMLRAFGCEVEERRDGFSVRGQPERPFRGARIDAAGDHRIAMAGAVAGLVADGPVRIDGAACVDTSFPGFAAVLGGIGVAITARDE